MNTIDINSISGPDYSMTTLTIIQHAADEVLDTLSGVQYKQAKVILQMALEKLDIRARVIGVHK